MLDISTCSTTGGQRAEKKLKIRKISVIRG